MCFCRKLVNHGLEFTAPCRTHAPKSAAMIELWNMKAMIFLDAENIQLFDEKYIRLGPLDNIFK